MHASGTFIVKTTPPQDAIAAGRFTLEQTFAGGLVGESKGQMLSAFGTVKGSGGYVAIETFTGTLDGKSGSFVLQHSGTMGGAASAPSELSSKPSSGPTLSVTVVPDSGTGELTGLSGTMTIDPSGGQHRYTFDYMLPR